MEQQKQTPLQDKGKRYETSISFTYDADSPQDAVKQFLANIPICGWYVDVKDIETGQQIVIDSETMEMQTLGNE